MALAVIAGDVALVTAIRIALGLLTPTSGSIRVLGLDPVGDLWTLRPRLGYMPGRFSLYPDLSVDENLHFFASVFGTRMASLVLGADAPAQAVFSEYLAPAAQRMQFRIYPRPGGRVYLTGRQEHGALPDDPAAIAPSEESCAELRRVGALHSSRLADAPELARSACHRPLTVDGLPLIGPVPGAQGAFLATAHGSWGLLTAPPTGRMVAEMILDGGSTSLDAAPFSPTRLPAGRI